MSVRSHGPPSSSSMWKLRWLIGSTAAVALVGSLIALAVFRSSGRETGTAAVATSAANGATSTPQESADNVGTLQTAGIDTQEVAGDGIGLVDPGTGVWHLRTRGGDPASFQFGDPADVPIIGDWDCDGVDTPGRYRQSDGYIYLRNSNTQGAPDVRFFFGIPGDIPLAGDFDASGCDTVSIFRASESRVFIINELGRNGGRLGAAAYNYSLGNPGDTPFAGDFNGDGTTTVGLHRESTGFVYLSNTNTEAAADVEFRLSDPGDRIVAGDWTGDGIDSLGVFRPSDQSVSLLYTNSNGVADENYTWGGSSFVPVAGQFGPLTSGVSVNVSGAPEGLKWAIESFYLELANAPRLPAGLRSHLAGLDDRPKIMTVTGTATTASAYGSQVAVVTSGPDVLLAVFDNGTQWRIVGAYPATQGRGVWFGDEPRFVVLVGSDWQQHEPSGSWPSTPLRTHADSVHIYSAVPSAGAGTLLGFPRDTIVTTSQGQRKVSKTMIVDGPAGTLDALRQETGLAIEGYLLTGMGTTIGGGSPPPGFVDLVNAYGGFPFLVPYNSPADGSIVTAGDTSVDGSEALQIARERQSLPHGDIDRSLAQGLLIKAAIADVQKGGILAMPGLLATMQQFVITDLGADEILTLAATIYVIDPGPMPTLTAADLADAGHTSGASVTESHGAYNRNLGSLPNVMVKGCWTPWTDPVTGVVTSGALQLQSQHYTTFTDLADGTLSKVPWSC